MNIQPLHFFLEEEISPAELAQLLDDFLFDYIDKLIKVQLLDNETYLHKDTRGFIYMIRQLIDILEQSAL